MGTASSKARALGFQGEPSDPATAWAIAVLDPKTYMTDSLWLSFALLEFHNKVSVYVFTRIQENHKANKCRYFALGLQLQQLMHQGTEDVVVIPVVHDECKDDVMHDMEAVKKRYYTQAEFAKEKGGVRLITLRGEISSGNGLAAANVGQASMTQGGALNGEEGRTELLEDEVCDGVGDNSGASESGSDGGSDSSKSPMRKRTKAEDLAEALMDETSRESQGQHFGRTESPSKASVPTATPAPPAGQSSAERYARARKGRGLLVPVPGPEQQLMTSFFSRPAADAEPQPERRMLSGCKPEEQKLPRRQHDDDDDDDADSNESNPRTDPGAGFASSTTKAGAAQGSGSKAGTADIVTKAQLRVLPVF